MREEFIKKVALIPKDKLVFKTIHFMKMLQCKE